MSRSGQRQSARVLHARVMVAKYSLLMWDGTFHHPRVSLETGVDLCPPVDGTCVLFASQTESNDLGS
jgi:hypothetical protein